MTLTNLYEDAARTRKAVSLASVLRAAGVTAEEAASMGAVGWRLAAHAAGTATPSARTCAVTVTLLAETAAA